MLQMHSVSGGCSTARRMFQQCLFLVVASSMSACGFQDNVAESVRKDKVAALKAQSPGNPAAWTARGKALSDLGEFDTAEDDLANALQTNPNYVDGLVARGTLNWRKGLIGNAERDFNRALEKDPRNIDAFRGRALVNLVGSRHEAALSDFQSVDDLTMGNTDPLCEMLKWFVHRKMKQSQQAQSVLDAALSKLPDNTLLKYGKHQISAEDLIGSASSGEDLTNARAVVAYDLILDGREQEAKPHLEWIKDKGARTALLYPLALRQLP